MLLCAGLKCCRQVSRVLAFTGQGTGSGGSLLTCDPKSVYEVGFISEKGKATAREVQWSLEAGGSLLR
jgi:hypothetical protein